MFYIYLASKLLAVYTASELRYAAFTDPTIGHCQVVDDNDHTLTIQEMRLV